jgi:hypothetical protein
LGCETSKLPHFLDNRLTDGGKEGLGKLKKISLIGTRTRDLPACSIVPQPTTLSRAPHTQIRVAMELEKNVGIVFIKRQTMLTTSQFRVC